MNRCAASELGLNSGLTCSEPRCHGFQRLTPLTSIPSSPHSTSTGTTRSSSELMKDARLLLNACIMCLEGYHCSCSAGVSSCAASTVPSTSRARKPAMMTQRAGEAIMANHGPRKNLSMGRIFARSIDSTAISGSEEKDLLLMPPLAETVTVVVPSSCDAGAAEATCTSSAFPLPHVHQYWTYLAYRHSAGGKNRTFTTKSTTIIVALRMPKAAMGITLLIAVARKAHMVVKEVTKMALDARSAVYVTRPRTVPLTRGGSYALCLKAS
mmetsp:Transcript_18088/g.44907  ORF Transcript_18088/g.44907 Transcript_18088/m.44907 type:complete len:268 (+) Transcript_18088:784-1587(+)